LRNLTDQAEEVLVGFPIDSRLTFLKKQGRDDQDWVLDYGFIARDEKATYHVSFVPGEYQKNPLGRVPESARNTFTWKMNFAAKETRTLKVRYHMPMSMTAASTRKDQIFDKRFWKLEQGDLEWAGYVTETGSSWAGNVEKATFTVLTDAYERYLTVRGFEDEPFPDYAAKTKEEFPVQHPQWFRQITPDGSKPIKGGVRWEYQDFKPKDPIEVRYYITQLPRLPQEVDPFVDRFLAKLHEVEAKRHETGKPASADLETVKQILLATYGQEPQDDAAKAFAKEQIWYAPQKGFSIDSLTAEQKAVLKEMDRRIELAKKQ
jgi:hypothetical protein